jgi:hypothetical protein
MPGLTVSMDDGGAPPEFQIDRFVAAVAREMDRLKTDPSDWSVNVVFIVPGRIARPDFVGVRSGKFDRFAGKLMVQVAVPDRPFDGWEAMADFVVESLEAATREADEFFRLEGLDVDLGSAWGEISALRHELDMAPRWAVDLSGSADEPPSPAAIAILAEFETRRAESAPIRARLRMRPTDAGGRHFPVLDAHTADFWLGMTDDAGQRIYEWAVIYLEDEDKLEPGGVGVVRVSPIVADRWEGIGVGAVLELCELSQVVGDATVIQLRFRTNG